MSKDNFKLIIHCSHLNSSLFYPDLNVHNVVQEYVVLGPEQRPDKFANGASLIAVIRSGTVRFVQSRIKDAAAN